MEFRFETVYEQKALTDMAKALRKTIRKNRSQRTHIFGWIVLVLALAISLPFGKDEYVVGINNIITWIAAVVILVTLLFEDSINGYFARKRMVAGSERAVSVFGEDGYTSETKIGKTEFKYENIDLIVETVHHFVFVFDMSHAQVYSKNGIEVGNVEDFRNFIAEKTGKNIHIVK